MPERFLLVDDDRDLCVLMTQYFAEYGFQVESAYDGRAALARLMQGGLDLIILDVMLPIVNGIEVLRQIRKRSRVPVVMLTARARHSDRIDGLNAGADDYLPKPFEPDELLARVRAILRRAGKPDRVEEYPIEAAGIRLNSRSREISIKGTPVALTAIEFDILEYLMRAAGRVVSRDELSAVLYQREANPYERSMDVHISHLRKKLQGTRGVIQGLRGNGYLFVPKGS
jgi:two-component system response regulator CpxR